MNPKPITVSPNSPLRDSYWLMSDNKVRRLPVMDNEHLVWTVTLEDLRRAEPPTGVGQDQVKIIDVLSRMTVRQVMTKDPRTIAPDAPLIEAARLMLEHKISALPVMEGSQLVGIITESDIFRASWNWKGRTKSSSMDKAGRSLWQLLLPTRKAGKPVHLTCEECFALLEYDAELLAGGAALDDIRAAVNHHLSLCPTCRTKFEKWLEELNGAPSHPDTR